MYVLKVRRDLKVERNSLTFWTLGTGIWTIRFYDRTLIRTGEVPRSEGSYNVRDSEAQSSVNRTE